MDKDIINILLLGLDATSPGAPSRADSIMILTMDRKHKSVKLTSLMRDMYVEIPGKGYNRINAAYAFGGPALAIKTVNANFHMNIKYYVSVDFFGFIKVIDKLGGVSVDIRKDEIKVINDYINNLNSLDKESPEAPLITNHGSQTLNGKQAVAYSRVRYVGNGDFERTQRQRTVLTQIMKNSSNISMWEMPGLVTGLLPYVKTNISKSNIISLSISAFKLRNGEKEQCRIPSEEAYKSQMVSGMAVLVPDMGKNRELLHDFIYGEGVDKDG